MFLSVTLHLRRLAGHRCNDVTTLNESENQSEWIFLVNRIRELTIEGSQIAW